MPVQALERYLMTILKVELIYEIVEAYWVKMEDDEELARQIDSNDYFGGPHKHCFTCYSHVLCDHSDDACDFTTCHNNCGAIFHGKL